VSSATIVEVCRDAPRAVTRNPDKPIGEFCIWITGAINSSFWPYYDRRHRSWPIPDGARIAVPAGYAEFPHEMLRPPRSLAERMYDIRRWTQMRAGGHFAALEEPEALATEIRAFFRPLRYRR
jgi:pimeloyl-ACP methyl ester carboxylesterase